MSSVGSSDSSANTANETIRRNREESQKAESDLVKKQAKDVRRLNEKHYEEIERLKADHDEQMQDFRKVEHEDISERDHKYQKDIEDMRGVYKKQLQAQADETSRREMSARQAREEGQHDHQNFDKRLGQLEHDDRDKLRSAELNFEENLKANRSSQERDLGEVHDRLVRRYEDEAKIVRGEHEKKVGDLQKNYDDYRKTMGTQLEEERTKSVREKSNDSNELIRAVRRERQEGVDNASMLRDGFKDGLEKTRERFEKQASDNREAQLRAQNNFKDGVGDRMHSEISRLKSENADMKEQSVRDLREARRSAQRENTNSADSFQKNIENYREQRDQALGEANDRVHKNTDKLRKDFDEQATVQSRYYLDKSESQGRTARRALDQMKDGFETQSSQTKLQADQRVKNISERTAEEKSRMIESAEEGHTAAQRNHIDEMRALRANLESDKDVAVNGLEERLQKQELSHADRMSQVVAKYEKQVQTLKDQIARDKKIGDENLKRTVEEMQRSHKTAVDQLEAQNKTRLHQQDQMHSEELRLANKRNDEKMNSLIVETTKRT